MNDTAQINMIAFTVKIVAWIVVVLLPLLLIGIVGKKCQPRILQRRKQGKILKLGHIFNWKIGHNKTKLTEVFAQQQRNPFHSLKNAL